MGYRYNLKEIREARRLAMYGLRLWGRLGLKEIGIVLGPATQRRVILWEVQDKCLAIKIFNCNPKT